MHDVVDVYFSDYFAMPLTHADYRLSIDFLALRVLHSSAVDGCIADFLLVTGQGA